MNTTKSRKEQAKLQAANMRAGEVRPEYSFSIRSDAEQQAVKNLLACFRQLPAEQ